MCSAVANISRSYFIPSTSTLRKGCGSHLTPVFKASITPTGERRPIEHQYTPMRLVHIGQNGRTKNTLDLRTLHRQLELHVLSLNGSGSSNILVSAVSFDCLVLDANGNEYREYIPFELKIPGSGSGGQGVFSYDQIESLYGSKRALYRALKTFYETGKTICNPTKCQHGHVPIYDYQSSKHDQYIRHTEQLLVAYLLLPEAATMLANRLRTTIRGRDPFATTAKVYSMGLHMHSTKTCCAPCENTLLGLMNTYVAVRQGRRDLGLLHNLQDALRQPHENLMFTLPARSPFRLITTVTASSHDNHHKRQPTYTEIALSTHDETPSYDIDIKSTEASQHVYETLLNTGHDPRKQLKETDLEGYTVGISGSRATSGSNHTIRKVRQIRRKEGSVFEDALGSLGL